MPQWTARFFAWGIHQVMRFYEPHVAERKKRLFGDLRGTVLEIGPGTGPNLKYLGQGVEWIGVEPNRHMFPYLRREADRLGLPVELVEGSAMAIPLPDASVDYVMGSLVLCSVPCQNTVLGEIHRVLKPGGEYRFVEHVAAPEGTWASRVQQWIKPVWCCCADGCHVDRRTWEALEAAPFGHLDCERFEMPLPIVSPHLMGRAVRT